MSPSKMSRKSLSLKEKIDIIKYHEENRSSVRVLAVHFKIGKSQVSEILKNKDALLRLFMRGTTNEKMYRLKRSGPGEVLNKLVVEWFHRVRSYNIPVTGPMVKEKAHEVASLLKMDKFKASNGWLDRFRTRNKIVFKAASLDAASVSVDVVNEWATKFDAAIQGFDEKDVYIANETTLFYPTFPDKAISGKSCSAEKISKERLTLLLCSNMAGEKERPLVIGKPLGLRCLKNITLKMLTVEWKVNNAACMTAAVTTQWLEQLNTKMSKQGRNILLFLGNALSHPYPELPNVKITSFPPNATLISQTMVQSVTRNFKMKYCKMVLRHIIANLECSNGAQELAERVDVVKVMTWIQESWNEVEPVEIKNSFVKRAFPRCGPAQFESDKDANELNQLFSLLPTDGYSDYQSIYCILTAESACGWMDDVATVLSDRNCVAAFENEEVDEKSSQRTNVHLPEIRSYTEGLKELLRLQEFYKKKEDVTGLLLVNQIILNHEKQTALSKVNKQNNLRLIE